MFLMLNGGAGLFFQSYRRLKSVVVRQSYHIKLAIKLQQSIRFASYVLMSRLGTTFPTLLLYGAFNSCIFSSLRYPTQKNKLTLQAVRRPYPMQLLQ